MVFNGRQRRLLRLSWLVLGAAWVVFLAALLVTPNQADLDRPTAPALSQPGWDVPENFPQPFASPLPPREPLEGNLVVSASFPVKSSLTPRNQDRESLGLRQESRLDPQPGGR